MAISTHVLDVAAGRAARGVPIVLDRLEAGAWQTVGSGATDDDGRLRTLTPPGPVAEGTYRIRFDTATYFGSVGVTAWFFPVAEVQFVVRDGDAHYHVPLLLSPFGYSTYRGT
jgi:5-hydroxyisourate hydrolase